MGAAASQHEVSSPKQSPQAAGYDEDTNDSPDHVWVESEGRIFDRAERERLMCMLETAASPAAVRLSFVQGPVPARSAQHLQDIAPNNVVS